MQMTDNEIVTAYRQALKPQLQIHILSELNECKAESIAKILENAGFKTGFKLGVKDEIVALRESGMSFNNIGETLNISGSAAQKHYRKTTGEEIRTRYRIETSKIQKCIELKQLGYNLCKISREVGLSTITIKKYLNKENSLNYCK